jgi:hypothetical protein
VIAGLRFDAFAVKHDCKHLLSGFQNDSVTATGPVSDRCKPRWGLPSTLNGGIREAYDGSGSVTTIS